MQLDCYVKLSCVSKQLYLDGLKEEVRLHTLLMSCTS